MSDFAPSAGKKIFGAKNFMTLCKPTLTEMRAEKPGAASYQNTLGGDIVFH